jgi:Zn2+/Cd2+-exporting ATPase
MTNHQHTNIQSDDTCCTPDLNAVNQNKNTQSKQTESESGISREWLSAIASFILLAAGLVLDNWIQPSWFEKTVRFAWYAVAYVPVGLPVLFKGIRIAFRGDMFTEFILMSIATLGAFYIGEYPEGVAVMLFYAVGELFQDAAVNKAKRSIKALMDMRPDTANVFRNGKFDEVDLTNVVVGETIQIKVGERVPLDGEMLSDGSSFNTAALTGESKPKSIDKGETVLAGMINEQKVVEVKVTKLFNESSLARILTLVQNATGRKAKTELFIRKFARVYTPIVVFLALALTLLPYFFVDNYVFNDWLYRALIFLVISCPCALVVAIPLGYFGGIGAGSRNGILFKGSNYLDLMTRVDTIVMDKTGTLTKGVFKVQKVEGPLDQKEWVPLIAALESQSTHPIAKAVVEYADSNFENLQVSDIEEIKGHGLKGTVNGKQVLAGNVRLLDKFGVAVTEEVRTITDSIVVASVNGTFAGYITIADELKEDSKEAIRQMHASKLKTVMLSGDKQVVANKIAKALNIDQAHGDLLPEHKVMKVEEIKAGKKEPIAFVGDGINDAPVLAISDVGIAMGGLGSDAAIETADVVIQTDQPSKIVTAIKIGKATNQIVWQNIALAFGVKVIVMALGAGGLATMWEAVFADVGVALLAILNAVRIQRMRF